MFASIVRRAALAAALAPLLLFAPRAAAASPEPGTVVTLADVEKELGGKWTSRSPEPGVLFYEEEGGGYRQVNVYLWPADGKTVEGMKVQHTGHGEPIEDVAGVGDAAMYRPQGNVAETEQKDPAGEVQWLTIAVHNAANAADTKRFAIALAKRGAERLKGN